MISRADVAQVAATAESRSKVWVMRDRISYLPEGEVRIARQFTAGSRFAIGDVPKGRLKLGYRTGVPFGRPFGTRSSNSSVPRLKGWAILKFPSGESGVSSADWPSNHSLRAHEPAD